MTPEEFDDWIEARLAQTTHTPRPALADLELDLPGNVTMAQGWLETQPAAVEGSANETLFKHAARLKDYGLSEDVILDMLAAHHPGYERDDIAYRIGNAFKYGQNEPGSRAGAGIILAAAERWIAAHRTPEPIIEGVTLLNGDDVEIEEYDWLWPGHYIRGKFHLFAAKPETGKNLITMSVAATLSRGGQWPDGTQAPEGDTLIWSGEDSFKDTTLPRFLAAGGVRNKIHAIGPVIDFAGAKRAFDPASDIGALMLAIERHPDIRYVVIDPVSVVVATGRGASNNDAEVRRALQPLLDLAEQRKLVVEGITHFAKESQRRGILERILASTAFGAVARMVHVAHKFSDDAAKPRLWLRAKCNVWKTMPEVGFEFLPAEVTYRDAHTNTERRAPRVAWGKPARGSVEQLIADEPDNDAPFARATAFLRNLLTATQNGRMNTPDIKRAHAAMIGDVSWKTVERAKDKLPIRVGQHLGGSHAGWFWQWLVSDDLAGPPPVLW